MDANKLSKLKEIGYTVKLTCGLCKHADIPPGRDFGTCKLVQYDHLKHSGGSRQLSIHRSGGCSKYEPSDTRDVLLHGFTTLLEEMPK